MLQELVSFVGNVVYSSIERETYGLWISEDIIYTLYIWTMGDNGVWNWASPGDAIVSRLL